MTLSPLVSDRRQNSLPLYSSNARQLIETDGTLIRNVCVLNNKTLHGLNNNNKKRFST